VFGRRQTDDAAVCQAGTDLQFRRVEHVQKQQTELPLRHSSSLIHPTRTSLQSLVVGRYAHVMWFYWVHM
jgi:hypothetical protein